MSIRTGTHPNHTVAVRRNQYGYYVEGDYFRRVTTLLKGLPKPFLVGWAAKVVAEYAVEHHESWTDLPPRDAVKLLKGVHNSKRDDAADRGSAIHAAIETHLKGTPPPTNLTDEQRGCANSVVRFLRRHVAEVRAVEMTVISRTHEYAGTLDLYALGRDGKRWILDWKTSKGVYPEMAIQLTAYRHAEYAIQTTAGTDPGTDAWTGNLIEWGPEMVDRMGIVHVQPDRATLYPINISTRLWNTFRAAAYVRNFQADTDSFNQPPRDPVFGDLVEFTRPRPRST